MKENNIEEDIKIVENYLAHSAINETDSDFFKNGGWETVDLEIPKSMQHILSDYKRVLKENEIYKKNSEIMSKENLSTAEQLKVEIKENFRLKNQLENNRKEYQETYKDIREELGELKKENEELKNQEATQRKINELLVQRYSSSIPVQKVKDKIEEYKNEIGQLRIERNVTYDSGIYKLELKREALQELLEKE